MQRWIRDLSRRRYPKGPRSQGGQDGILGELFRHIPTAHDPPFCVECGFNSTALDGGTGSNVATLVIERGWRALLLDSRHENAAINLQREFLTTSNVLGVFATHGVPSNPDYISIDVDSTDLWLFRVLAGSVRASVFSVEYNAHLPLHLPITCADTPDVRWTGDRAYGASLGALDSVAREHGYSLVAVEPGLDAFFVRDDLIDDGSGEIAPPLSHWRPATLMAIHPPVPDGPRCDSFLNYHTWRQTVGDVARAHREAARACRPYLQAGPLWFRWARLVDQLKGWAHVG